MRKKWTRNRQPRVKAIMSGLVQGLRRKTIAKSFGYRNHRGVSGVIHKEGLVDKARKIEKAVEINNTLRALIRAKGKRGKAAEMLRIGRNGLYYRLKRAGIGDEQIALFIRAHSATKKSPVLSQFLIVDVAVLDRAEIEHGKILSAKLKRAHSMHESAKREGADIKLLKQARKRYENALRAVQEYKPKNAALRKNLDLPALGSIGRLLKGAGEKLASAKYGSRIVLEEQVFGKTRKGIIHLGPAIFIQNL